MHTPDSSRYWIAHTYEERFKNGLEPENVDKVCDVFYTSCSFCFFVLLILDELHFISKLLTFKSFDSKEFLRLWFKDHCNPYEDEVVT